MSLFKTRYNNKRILFVATMTLSLTVATLSVNADSSSEPAVEQHTTPAGHTLWYYPMPQAERTALAISWQQQVPVKDMHPSTARLAIDLMLNGGAGDRDAAQIVADYQDLDAGSGLWADAREVSGFIVAPNEHLSKAREIAHQVLAEPALGERWFEREHQELLEAVSEERSSTWGLAGTLLRQALLKDHPYNNFWSDGPIDKIESISLDHVKAWHKSSFSTASTTVVAAGSADPDVIAKELDLLFAKLPKTKPVEPIDFPKPTVPGKTVLLHKPDAPKTAVIVLGSFPSHSQDNDIPLQLGVGVLGLGQHSRLFKTVRAGLGASYGFGAEVFNFTQEHRFLEMAGEIETDKLSEALDEIEQAYSEFQKDGIGRVEFPLAKRFFKREVEKQLNNPVAMAFSVNESVKKGFSTDYAYTLLDHIDSLKRDKVNNLISTSFPRYDQLLKIIVSSDKNALSNACVIENLEEMENCF